MKKPHADINQDTSIEILWKTDSNTLHLLLFRISRGAGRTQLTTEQIARYHCLAELRQQLCVLFGELSARRIWHNPSLGLPPYHLGLFAAPPSRTTVSGLLK